LHVFPGGPGGVYENELTMLYILPFVGLDGKEYILRSDKHMPGDECRDLAQQTITLYVHVLDGGEGEDATVVSSGIVRIDGSGIIDLILSLEVCCENEGSCGVAPRVQGLLAWGSILLADVLENCLGFVPELPDRDLPLLQVSIQFEEYIAGYAVVGGGLGMDVGDYQDFYDRGVENGDAIAFARRGFMLSSKMEFVFVVQISAAAVACTTGMPCCLLHVLAPGSF
jgi:hypothetical protein